MHVLAGDIGGTKTLLAVFQVEGASLTLHAERERPSAHYDSLDAIVAEMLAEGMPPVAAAAFGIAGPVSGRRARTTNLPWVVDADALEQGAGIPRVRLLNDLEATAWGVPELAAEDLLDLTPGVEPAPGNAAVIAAGTGLGEAGLYWDGARHLPFATEAGHAGFAPEDAEQAALWRFMTARHGRVSWERVLAGPAIPELLEFVTAHRGEALPAALADAVARGDAAAVTAAADAGDPLCAATLTLFARLYGAEAGNLALRMLARGGVYLGGGIAPKILPWLTGPDFREAFLAKGRMRGLMEQIPVRLVRNSRTALLGAARCATLA